MTYSRRNNLLFITTLIICAHTVSTTAQFINTQDVTSLNGSAQPNKVVAKGDCFYGTVGEIKENLQANIDYLSESCEESTSAVLKKYLQASNSLAAAIYLSTSKDEDTISAELKKIVDLGVNGANVWQTSWLNHQDIHRRQAYLKTLVEQLVETAKEDEAFKGTPIENHIRSIIFSSIQLNSITVRGLIETECYSPKVENSFLVSEKDRDLSNIFGNLSPVASLKSVCDDSNNDFWEFKSDPSLKKGVAVNFWFSSKSLEIRNESNLVLDFSQKADTYAQLYVNKLPNLQTEIVFKWRDEENFSFVSKCNDMTWVLISVEEDCEDLVVNVVIRNLLNNSRDHWVRKIKLTDGKFAFKTVSLGESNNLFKRYNEFKYNYETEQNAFALSINTTKYSLLERDFSRCKLPPHCTYFAEECLKCEEGWYLHDGNCVSKCPSGFWENVDRCKHCDESCTECIGETKNDCTKCSHNLDGLNLLISASSLVVIRQQETGLVNAPHGVGLCERDCPSGTFKKIFYTQGENESQTPVEAVCTPCEKGCTDCIDEETCKKCKSPRTVNELLVEYYLYEGDCVENCPPRTWLNRVTNSCDPCEANCLNCRNSEICTNCEEGHPLFENDCLPKCPQKYFDNNNVCQPCLANCLTCKSSDECEQCEDKYKLLDKDAESSEEPDECHQDCSDGYTHDIIDGVDMCVKCTDNHCVKCTPDHTKCDRCEDKWFVHEHKCKHECPIGTWENHSNGTCSDCLHTCRTCSSKDSCDECKAGLYYHEGECLEDCPNGFIVSGNNCVKCEKTEKCCEKCQSATSEICIRCQPDKWLNDETGKCMKKCENGFFIKNLTDKICNSCSDVNCLDCPDNKCRKCKENLVWNGRSCEEKCEDGYARLPNGLNPLFSVFDSNHDVCHPCKVNECSSCNQNTNECDDCFGELRIWENECIPRCPKGTYSVEERGRRTCRPCSKNCSLCKNDQECELCDDESVLHNNVCISECPEGWVNRRGVCEKCSEGCKSCEILDIGTRCDVCQSPKVLFENKCLDHCPEKMFDSHGECRTCLKNCQKCSNGDSCEICEDNWLPTLIEGKTVCVGKCGNGKAQVPNQECLNCKGEECSKACNEYECHPCSDENCLVCDPLNLGDCKDCDESKTNKYLQPLTISELERHSICKERCDDGYYADDNDECRPCKVGCSTCNGSADDCQDCETDYFLLLSAVPQTCVPHCPNGTYITPGDNACGDCTDKKNCNTCNPLNPDECVVCLEPTYNYSGKCVTDCQKGKKIVQTQVQAECHNCTVENCNTCDSTQCDRCLDGYFLLIVGDITRCVPNCGKGFVENPRTGVCEKCQVENCDKCRLESLTQCEECSGDLRVLVNREKCGSCGSGTYVSDDLKRCNPCRDEKCDVCDKLGCKVCNKPYFLLEGGCENHCPAGQVGVDGNCQNCLPVNCAYCSGPESKDCHSCESPFHIHTTYTRDLLDKSEHVNKFCIAECPVGTFSQSKKLFTWLDNTYLLERECSNCSTNCLDCEDENNCKRCTEETTLLQGECVDKCPHNQIEIANKCEKCETGLNDCKVCDESKATCKECLNINLYNRLHILIDCIETCPSGHFLDGRNCIPCSSNCLECSNDVQCKECDEHFYLQVTNPICKENCEEGQFGKDKRCNECSTSGCQLCAGDNCSKCHSPLLLKNVGTRQECTKECGEGYYENDGSCLPCEENCSKCKNSEICTRCNESFFLHHDDCVTECVAPFTEVIDIALGNECKRCKENCSDCLYNSVNSCSDCDEHYYLQNENCVVDCGPGQVAILNNNGKRVCVECGVKNCEECNPNPLECTKCRENLFLKNNTCVEQCDDGYIGQLSVPRECRPCKVEKCKDCQGNEEVCNVCDGDLALLDPIEDAEIIQECLPKCPFEKGMYEKLIPLEDGINTKVCKKCPVGCETCTTVDNQPVCDKCKKTYFLINGVCKQECGPNMFENQLNQECTNCEQKGCKECPNNVCEECNEPLVLQVVNNEERLTYVCKDLCDSGYFNLDGICRPCGQDCLNCHNRNECNVCNDKTFLDEHRKCVPQCEDGWYETNNPNICNKCKDHNCRNCNSSGICENCHENWLLLVDTKDCHQECPSNYFVQGDRCLRCTDENCLNCKDDSCVKCKDKMVFQNGKCVNDCEPSHALIYSSGYESKVCDPCEKNCQECEPHGNSTVCVKCTLPHVLNQRKECVKECDDGWWINHNEGKCSKCSVENCASCPLDVCKECVKRENGTLYYLLNEGSHSICVEECPSGQTPVQNVCTHCNDSNCKTCKNIDSCDNCNNIYFYFITHRECRESGCDEGYYRFIDSNGRDSCGNCKRECAACSNEDSCTKCKEGEHLLDGACVTDCGDNKIGTNGKCENCHDKNCKLCDSNSANSCKKCQAPFLLNHLGECVEKCEDNYWSEGGECRPCSVNCASCKNVDICNQCVDGSVLVSIDQDPEHFRNECRPSCPEYQYNLSGICRKCADRPSELINCLNCDLPLNADLSSYKYKCNQCEAGKFLHEGKCVSNCPTRHFAKGDKCEECNHGCAECSNFETCDLCYEPYFRTNHKTCTDDCGEGYFGNENNRECNRCGERCNRCKDENKCVECKEDESKKLYPLVFIGEFFFSTQKPKYSDTCLEECPEGSNYYNLNGVPTCRICSSHIPNCRICSPEDECLKCEGDSVVLDGKCSNECGEGKVNINGICKNCHENCDYCLADNRTYCTKCRNPLALLYNGECLDRCPLFHYQFENTCKRCGDNCRECDGDGCKICKPDFYLYSDRTCGNCERNSGLVRINEENNNKCVNCNVLNCQLCIEGRPNQCEKCIDSWWLYADNCYESCPNKTYPLDSNDCRNCDENCALCTSQKSCQKCVKGSFLLGDQCLSECPVGYYNNTTENICEKCNDPNCQKCDNGAKNQCTLCNKTHYLLFKGLCTDKCKDPYFEEEGTCKECSKNCTSCLSGKKCDKCQEGFLMEDGTCVDKCSDEYYIDVAENGEKYCKRCAVENCKHCNEKECHVCHIGSYLKEGQCVTECGEEYYLVEERSACEPCGQHCHVCDDNLTCRKCKNGWFLTSDNKCENTCPEGYVGNPLTRECERCNNVDCLSCTSGDDQTCYKCKLPKILMEGHCVEACLPNFYHDEFNNKCEQCSSNCAHCSLERDHESCLSCVGEYRLIEGKCVNSCPEKYTKVDDNCVRCYQESCEECAENSKQCTKCSEESDEYLFKGHCLEKCPEGYFENDSQNGRICSSCPDMCDRCHVENNQAVCDVCENGFFMNDDGNCLRVCPDGTYPHCDTRTCEVCDESCGTCYNESPDNCITCAKDYFMSAKRCVKSEDCPIGMFGLNGNCEFCSVNNCDKCTELGTCSACQQGFVLKENKCVLSSSYYSVIGHPRVAETPDQSPVTINIFENLPELATSHKVISLSFWIRLINEKSEDKSFRPLITLTNQGDHNISFGILRNGDQHECAVVTNGGSFSVKNCNYADLQNYNFFAINLVLGDNLRVTINRALTNSDVTVEEKNSISFDGKSIINEKSEIVLNREARIHGSFEISKFYVHDYQLKGDKVAEFLNDKPSKCDYYCNSCGVVCNNCANGSIVANDWRCPAGGFAISDKLFKGNNTEHTNLSELVSHDFSSGKFQLNFWIFPTQDKFEIELKSDDAVRSALKVNLSQSDITVNGQSTGILIKNKVWSHVSVKIDRTKINVQVHDILKNVLNSVQRDSDTFARLYTYSVIEVTKNTGASKVSYTWLLINNTTDLIKEISLPPNCSGADIDFICNACDSDYELNSINQCVRKQEGPQFVELNPDAHSSFSDESIVINNINIASTKGYALSFWVRKLMQSVVTDENTLYNLLSLNFVGNKNIVILSAEHKVDAAGKYTGFTDLVSGSQRYSQDLNKLTNSYVQWQRVILQVNDNKLTLNVIENGVSVLNSEFEVKEKITSFTLAGEASEINTTFAKLRMYNKVLSKSELNNDTAPKTCDGGCRKCNVDEGKCETCISDGLAANLCKPYLIGFKAAYNSKKSLANNWLAENELHTPNFSSHMWSDKYSVIGSFTHVNLDETETPDGVYTIFNVTENYEERIGEESTSSSLIAFQVEYKDSKKSYSFKISQGLDSIVEPVALKIEYLDQVLIHAGIDVLNRNFKYLVFNLTSKLSKEATVALKTYPEALNIKTSLRLIYNNKQTDRAIQGLFTHFYLMVNRFYEEKYVDHFKKMANPACQDTNCSFCANDETNTNVCYLCKTGFVAVNGVCEVKQVKVQKRVLLQGDLVKSAAFNTTNLKVIPVEQISSIKQISFYLRQNFHSISAQQFLSIGGANFKLNNIIGTSEIVITASNKQGKLKLPSKFGFNHIRMQLENSKILIIAEDEANNRSEVTLNLAVSTILSSTLNKYGFSNADNQVQIYGIELLTSLTEVPTIGFRELDCQADFTFCHKNTPFLTQNHSVLIPDHDEPVQVFYPAFLSSISTVKIGVLPTLSLNTFNKKDNFIRSRHFTLRFQLNWDNLPDGSSELLNLANNYGRVQSGAQYLPLLELNYNKSGKSLTLKIYDILENNPSRASRIANLSINKIDNISSMFVKIECNSGKATLTVIHGREENSAELNYDKDTLIITNSSFVSFSIFSTHTDQTKDLFTNFVFDYAPNTLSYSDTDIYRITEVSGCSEGYARVNDACLEKSSSSISAFNNQEPFIYFPQMQEDTILKINEIDIAHDKSHVSFWYKQSNVRVESEHPIIDFKINDQSHIRVNFEDSGLTVYVQNVNVWHSPQVDESLRQWMNITVILDSTTKILDIQVYNRKGEEVFDSIPLIKLNNVKQLLKAGENSGTVHIGDLSNNSPNSFMLYNLVCGLGGLSDELSQAPSKFPRSCKEGTLESGCYKSLDIELIFAEFNEIPNPEYTFQPLFTLTNLALEYSRSFIYAPSFSFNLRLENLDFETFETNKEVLFAIAGGATLETIGNLTNINEYDVSKSNFAIIVENKKLLKGYVNTRSHTLIVNLNPDMNDQHKLPTDVNINFIFDGVRNLLTVRYDADDFTSVVSHHNLNFEPITSASNIYKKHGQGHAILNLRGQPIVDSESLTSKRESTFCNREQSRALTCEYVHKFQTALALTCEDGWTVNEGLCVKTNTLN